MIDKAKMYEAIDLIAKGLCQPTRLALALGMAYRTYRSWLVRSNRGDPAFLITVDGEEMQFAKAVALYTKLALFELRGKILQESIYGYDEVQTKDGNIVLAWDLAALAVPEEDRELLGYRKDALLEIDGKLQPVVLKKKAPFAQQLALLQAAFADLRPSQTINQNLNVQGQVGIAVAKPVDYSRPPPIVPPPPPMPVLAAPATDAEFSEIDDDLADLLGPEPQPAPAPVPVNVILAPEISVTMPDASPTPIGFDEVPLRAPRSELERDLFEKLRQARERAQP